MRTNPQLQVAPGPYDATRPHIEAIRRGGGLKEIHLGSGRDEDGFVGTFEDASRHVPVEERDAPSSRYGNRYSSIENGLLGDGPPDGQGDGVRDSGVRTRTDTFPSDETPSGHLRRGDRQNAT